MPLVLTAGPAEDTLVASLIVTSRLHVEAGIGLALVTQSWSYFLDCWPPAPALKLPLRPVQAIDAVRLYDDNAVATTVPPETYFLDGSSAPARLVRQGAIAWPKPGRVANGIEVAFTAGFGDAAADVPGPIRQAILLLVAHWYEHRSPLEIGAAAEPVPGMVGDLLGPYRSPRL